MPPMPTLFLFTFLLPTNGRLLCSWLYARHQADCRFANRRDPENSSIRSPKFAQEGMLLAMPTLWSAVLLEYLLTL